MGDQEFLDAYYFKTGPCCAGCDQWQSHNRVFGECTKAAPMPAKDRVNGLGVHSCSMNIGAGHPFTRRDRHCGAFKDEFDWTQLPLGHRKRIGFTPQAEGE